MEVKNINEDEVPDINDHFKSFTELDSRLEKLEKRMGDIKEIIYKSPVI